MRGNCPRCHLEGELEYGPVEFEGDNEIYFPFTCPCGCEGKEWYKTEYIESTDDNEK